VNALTEIGMSADKDMDVLGTWLLEIAKRHCDDDADTGKTERDRIVTQAILEDV
jgi:hypothetical protein